MGAFEGEQSVHTAAGQFPRSLPALIRPAIELNVYLHLKLPSLDRRSAAAGRAVAPRAGATHNSRGSDPFDQRRGTQSSPTAHGDQSALGVLILQNVQQCGHQTCTTGADGMS
ncbi:MAG: hypothetical protein QOJ61_1404 [Mycobacterium sp.]|nr:hypothetical protein [Mycobacterium sp.]